MTVFTVEILGVRTSPYACWGDSTTHNMFTIFFVPDDHLIDSISCFEVHGLLHQHISSLCPEVLKFEKYGCIKTSALDGSPAGVIFEGAGLFCWTILFNCDFSPRSNVPKSSQNHHASPQFGKGKNYLKLAKVGNKKWDQALSSVLLLRLVKHPENDCQCGMKPNHKWSWTARR